MDLFINSDFSLGVAGNDLTTFTDSLGCAYTNQGGPQFKISTTGTIYATAVNGSYAATALTHNGYYTLEWDFVMKTADTAYVIGMWDLTSGDHLSFGARVAGSPQYEFVVVSGGIANTVVIPATFSGGETHHAIFRLKAGSQQLYIDNVLIYSGSIEVVYKLGTVGFSQCGGTNTTGIHIANFKVYLEDSGDPFTLPGTQISPMPLPKDRLRCRAHRRGTSAPTLTELWYYRDGAWRFFPTQPSTSVQDSILIAQQYKQPYTMECVIPNPFTANTPTDENSAVNQSIGGYNALIAEARQVLLRAGTACYANLARGKTVSCDHATAGSSLNILTNDDVSVNGLGNAVEINFIGDSAPRILTIDLGSVQQIHHLAAVFMTPNAAVTLPMQAQFSASDGSTTWTFPKRPLGGPTGDWDDDPTGGAYDFIQPDVDVLARYIYLTVYATDSRTVCFSEIAVYGGATIAYLGANLFGGYLGDGIQVLPNGRISIHATDTQKRLADAAETKLSKKYTNSEIADIAYALLTDTAYWTGATGNYSAPFATADICWTTGIHWTNFQFPRWQGANNTILGYEMELWQTIGWHLYTTGNGRLAVLNPPVSQYRPDRVCVAGAEGMPDVWNCERDYNGKDLRNVCHVSTAETGNGLSGDIVSEDKNSIALYGRRAMYITDSLSKTAAIRQQTGKQVVREYAWRLGTLQNEIFPDYETAIKQIFGFRADLRPQLFAHASTTPGSLRAQELWSLEGIRHSITYGRWTAQCDWRPYFPQLDTAPTITSVASSGASTSALVTWTAYTGAYASATRVYWSQVSASGPFTVSANLAANATTYNITGLAAGTVWAYVVAVDAAGYESANSTVLSTTVGAGPTSSASLTGWKVTDLAVGYVAATGMTGPDATGFYTYEFSLTWTVPASGMTRFSLYYALGSVPTTDAGWTYAGEWNSDLIAAGHEIQAPATAGVSAWYGRLRNSGLIASTTNVYWRMTSYTRRDRTQDPQNSNTASVAIP